MTSPKVIVVLTSFCAEGTPVLVLGLLKEWLRQGIQPVVVTLKKQPTDLLSEFEILSVPIHCLDMGDRGYYRYVKLILSSYHLCRHYLPEALLSMPLGWHSFIAWGAKLAGVRTIFAHVGNYPPHWKGIAFQKFCLEIQLGRPVTDGLICCSDYIRQGVIQHFKVNSAETITIYNGCPPDLLAKSVTSVANHPGAQPFVIGMVARLEQHKDQPTLIRAARLLKDQGLNIQVQLIGEGSRRREYETLIDELFLQNTVQLLGMRRDISSLLQQMDVFVFSAKPDEGFGIALVEAMSAGVPVVATGVGACKEVLQNGLAGILVEPDSPERLANGILRVIRFPQEAANRAQLAQERARVVFSVETMAQAYARELKLSS